MMFSASMAAAHNAGGKAVVYMNGRPVFLIVSIRTLGPATKPPSAPMPFDSVPTDVDAVFHVQQFGESSTVCTEDAGGVSLVDQQLRVEPTFEID